MLAEVLQRQHPKNIVRYHEHDLLLENVESEELTEEERKQAWKSYEEEKENAASGIPSKSIPLFIILIYALISKLSKRTVLQM